MPKRCLSCRQARKERQMSRGNYNTIKPGFRSEQRLYPVTCTQCGKETQVPFEPKAGREVYCRECYRAVKVSQ
jgi:CxxC-x17-CxxC domain-containing protein